MQVTKGDNTTERPMWAEKGGLDFEGRARWDAWTNNKASFAATSQLHYPLRHLGTRNPAGTDKVPCFQRHMAAAYLCIGLVHAVLGLREGPTDAPPCLWRGAGYEYREGQAGVCQGLL
jgi:hypothetical protein